MTRALLVATLILGNRPVTLPRDHVSHESGKIAMARALLSLPALVEAWRGGRSRGELRGQGDARRADAVDRCADELEAAIGTTNGREAPRSEGR